MVPIIIKAPKYPCRYGLRTNTATIENKNFRNITNPSHHIASVVYPSKRNLKRGLDITFLRPNETRKMKTGTPTAMISSRTTDRVMAAMCVPS